MQFYAIMKATYAGGKSSYIQSYTRPIDHTASADVVFTCFPGGHCFSKYCFTFNLGLDFAGDCCRLFACACPNSCSASTRFISSSSLCVCTSDCSLPGGSALSNFRSAIQRLPHRFLQRP